MALKKTPKPEATEAHQEPVEAPAPAYEPTPAATSQPAPAPAAEVDNAEAARKAGEIQRAQDKADRQGDQPVRKYRSRHLNMRDPISGILYYADRPTVGEPSHWLTSQLKANLIEEV